MSTTQSVEVAPIKTFFCDSFEECKSAKGLLPIQVIGLAPMEQENTDDCRPDPCQTLCVFANGSGIDRENDKSYYLFDFPTAAGDTYELEQYDTATETWSFVRNLDGTTGEKFTFGTWQPYPFRAGVCIDWDLVRGLDGFGVYRIALTGLFGAPAPKLVSLPYKLKPFTCAAADGTVRVKTETTGLIDNINWVETIAGVKTFDMEFMSWDDQIRYTGNFYDASAKREVSTYLKGSNRRQTHRQFLKKQFTLRANGLIQDLVDRLDMYGGFSAVVRVSNYEENNAKHYTDRGVIIEEATCEYTWQLSRQLAVVTLTLSDRYDREAGRC